MNTYAYDEKRLPRWLLVAGAVLAVVALLAVGVIIGRTTAPSSGSRTQAVNAQGGPGPARVVNGVPVGYAHTQAGAVAAATNYLETFYGPLVTEPDKYRAAVNEIVAPDSHDKMVKLAEDNLTGQQTYITYAAQGRAIVHRVVPLTYKVESFSDTDAQVSIWGETLVAVDGVISLREGWVTTNIATEWAEGDWKLADIPTAPGADASYGSVPTALQAPSQSPSLPSQLSNYRSYLSDAT